MVLRILHPILASTLCAANPLARIAEPTIEMLMGNLVSASTGQLWTEIASCAPRHQICDTQTKQADEKRVSLRERSEPGANAPTKAQAVGVGPRGTNTHKDSI